MKKYPLFVAVAAMTAALLAEDAKKAAPAPKAGATRDVAVLSVTAAKITAPLKLKDGAIGQPEQTELADGGKATFEFSVPTAGDYLIYGVVSAPGEEANSFFINVDAPPQDPLGIWDFDVTNGFEERVVSWRGNGSPEEDEFKPKVFNLTAGAHKIFLVGREPAQLKSLVVRPAAK